ncbi:MAG: TVP38/TMEM64 family protein [Deltaproteobacteria bacterium]|nr:TVP38/TMEM64 family protein [Deltaproteobacteria bacterium]
MSRLPEPAPGAREDRRTVPDPHRLPPRVVLFAALLAAAAAAFVAAWALGWISPTAIQLAARRAGPWAFAVFVAAVFVGELLWMPRLWGLVAGGLLFGPVAGSLLSLGTDLAAAMTAWALARSAARDWVARLLHRRPKAERIVGLFAERRGTLTLAVLRMCPIAHYTLVSFAAGLGGVRAAPFLLGTAVGNLPGAVLYPLLGDSITRPTSPVFLGGLAVLAVALVVTLHVGRRLLRETAPPS